MTVDDKNAETPSKLRIFNQCAKTVQSPSYQEQFVNYFEKPPMIQVEPVIGNSNEYETPVNLQALGEEVINSPTNAINTPLLPVYEEDNIENH